jgi:hypothetical protein
MSCDCRSPYRKVTDYSETWSAGESGESVTSPIWWGVRTDSVESVGQYARQINSTAVHTPFASFGSGRVGRRKQTENRAWVTETYAVVMPWFQKAVALAGQEPTVDAFASKGNNRVSRYWTKQDDAFLQDWSQEYLWMNPPFSQMETVIRKILVDEARGILVIPCWNRFLWFSVLYRIAVTWIDVPRDVQLYETIHGKALDQRPDWRSRIVVFDAFGWRKTGLDWNNWMHVTGISPLREILYSEQDDRGHLLGQPSLISSVTDRRCLYSVIESAGEHPDAHPYIQKIQDTFQDVLYQVKLARDVDPTVRGPFGVAHFERQDSAVP